MIKLFKLRERHEKAIVILGRGFDDDVFCMENLASALAIRTYQWYCNRMTVNTSVGQNILSLV